MEKLISFMLSFSFFAAFLQVALAINKLWSRKHLKEVADSLSLESNLLGILTTVPLIPYFISAGEWAATGINIVFAVYAVFFAMVSLGWWVRKLRNRSVWFLILRALNMEYKDMVANTRSFLRPKGAELVVQLLHDVAWLDGKLAQEEIETLNRFTTEWNLPPIDTSTPKEISNDITHYINIRNTVDSYLELEPPTEQVEAVTDLIHMMMHIDNEINEATNSGFMEVVGKLERYCAEEDSDHELYHVVIIPQKEEQEKLLKVTLPNIQPIDYHGGKAWIVDTFHSKYLGEKVVEYYQELHIYTHLEHETVMGSSKAKGSNIY